MNPWLRFLAFNCVGLGGVGVQLLSMLLLTRAGVHYVPATVASVTVAVVHNFIWHRRWTWRDRPGARARTFFRFALANGAVSLAGNLGVMTTLVSGAGMPPVIANAVAIAVCGLVNFWLGDEVVFTSSITDPHHEEHEEHEHDLLMNDKTINAENAKNAEFNTRFGGVAKRRT